MSKPAVAILSPGAVGGFLAARLWRAGYPVTCVASPATAARLAADGLRLDSPSLGDVLARPRVVTQLDSAPELVFVAPKAPGLAAVMAQAAPEQLRAAVIVPLLNGVEHVAVLRARYGPAVAAGSIGLVELVRHGPAHIAHLSKSALITLAANDPALAARLPMVTEVLADCDVRSEILDSEAAVLWGKLVRLNAIALTTAASQQPVGVVRSVPSWRAQLAGCANEGAAVATAEGLPLDGATVLAQIDALPAQLGTSLQRDVAAGRPSELDAIAGAVVRAGERHGLPCPTIRALIADLQTRS